jgi:hypothetical protein
VLSKDVQIKEITISEFEFEDGLWSLHREKSHWGIVFESEDGEEGIIVEREDFLNGEFGFEIDGSEHELLLEDFDKIDKFYHEKYVQ